jgi:hypothetical protein
MASAQGDRPGQTIACNRGLWEDLGNSYLTKRPKKKRTSVQLVAETEPDDQGTVRLRVNPQHAGPAPRIHYAVDGPVTEQSPVLADQTLPTNALCVRFLVRDPSGQYETGEPVTWHNKLVIRNRLFEEGGGRKLELLVAPTGALRYTLDGSEPRDGIPYQGPFGMGDGEVLVRAFATADGLEAKADFRFPARGKKGPQIDELKPACLVNNRGGKKLDSRAKTFSGLSEAREKGVTFENVTVTVGESGQAAQAMILFEAPAEYIEAVLSALLTPFEPAAPVTMTFRRARFASGFDLKRFAEALGLDIQPGEVEQ